MSNKQTYIKADHIARIDEFLCKAYNVARSGYVKISMSEIARNAKVTVKVSETLKAVRNLGILKQQGKLKASMWYWPGNSPDIDTAEKVYNEIKRISVNQKLDQITDNSVKAKGLIPIQGTKRPGKLKHTTPAALTASRVSEILTKMNQNEGTLFILDTACKEYNVNISFFKALIDLDIVQPFNRVPGGFYKMTSIKAGNKDVIVDLIMESYKHTDTPKKGNEKSADERAEQVFDLLKFIDRNPFKGSMHPMLKERGLASLYQTVAMRLGYIINTGTTVKPVYQLVGMPNISMAHEIVAGVREYWNKGEMIVPVMKQQPADIKQSVIPTDNDLNGMLERAIKRKEYLATELAKVDKIIESANAIKKLTAELMNN